MSTVILGQKTRLLLGTPLTDMSGIGAGTRS